jgi:hypothetical protein
MPRLDSLAALVCHDELGVRQRHRSIHNAGNRPSLKREKTHRAAARSNKQFKRH